MNMVLSMEFSSLKTTSSNDLEGVALNLYLKEYLNDVQKKITKENNKNKQKKAARTLCYFQLSKWSKLVKHYCKKTNCFICELRRSSDFLLNNNIYNAI